MNKKIMIIFFISIMWVTSALADMFTPSHSCSKPYKPYQFNSEWEIENFQNEIESYKRCIVDFVDEQNEAITKHQNASNDAIEEWNRFVNYELN